MKKARVEMLDDAACVQHQRPPFVVRKVDPDLITSRGYLSDPLEEPVETPGEILNLVNIDINYFGYVM